MRVLSDIPRWLIIAALVFAPWFYGSTTEKGIVALTWWLTAAVALWVFGWALRALRARAASGVTEPGYSVPLVLGVASVALIAFGWWMVLNAGAVYDADFASFVRVSNLARALPGSIDHAVSAAWMWRASVLLGTMLVVADACRDSAWLMRFCTAMAATGGSIAFLGLVQKATHAPMIFWRAVDQPVTTFFATFFYHGNAGAFLNLTLPLTIGLAWRAFGRRDAPLARAVWLTLAVVSTMAVFANTSRMGHAVAAVVLVVLAGGLVWRTRQARRRTSFTAVAVGALALLVAGYAMMRSVNFERSLGRWEHAAEIIPADARWMAASTALRALPEAGWFGFGPGTFHVVFPYLTGATIDERVGGFWRHLHQDYLQTVLEWGWVGAAVFGVVFFGGMAAGLTSRYGQQAEEWLPRQRILLPMVILALAGVALHAAVDFPLQIASIQLYVAVLLGICWSARTWRTTDSRRQSVALQGRDRR